MAADPGSFSLLAMPPSGEIFLAMDAHGTTWLVHPPGAGEPDKIPASAVEATVEEAVTRHGWDRVEQSFASWADLDDARQRLVAEQYPLPPLEVANFDEQDVREVLEVVRSWVAAGDSRRGLPALHRLLHEASVVWSDHELRAEVTSLLVRLDREAAPPPFSTLTMTHGSRSQQAMQRMQLPQAA